MGIVGGGHRWGSLLAIADIKDRSEEGDRKFDTDAGNGLTVTGTRWTTPGAWLRHDHLENDAANKPCSAGHTDPPTDLARLR